MNTHQNFEYLYKLLDDVAQQFDFTKMQILLEPICEKTHIVKIDGSIYIPETSIHKEESKNRVTLYVGSEDADDTRKVSATFANDRLHSLATANIYWAENYQPDEEMLQFYQAIHNVLYLLQSRNGLIMALKQSLSHDQLTGLISKDIIAQRYDREVSPEEKSSKYSFLFINVENMKFYNKTYGSEVGDEILKIYAKNLRSLTDDEEYITRLGGDNFCLTVKNDHLDYILEKIAHVPVSGITELDGKTVFLSCWTGISKDVSAPLPYNARLYQASFANQLTKSEGVKRRIVYFSSQMDERSLWAKQVIAGFSASVENNEYLPYYQPKVHIPTGRIIGMEALVRWKKNGELVPPGKFIPILEQDGLISELDIYMLDKTCADIRKWLDQGLSVPRVSVNLSRKNLYTEGIVQKIIAVMTKYSIPADGIEIEITETTTLEEFNLLVSLAKDLHENGIRVSIDDFGTGYSSLSMLKDVYADIVKIDKTFVDDCLKEKRSYILIKSIIALASELQMEIISEGVETSEQADFLMGVGCKNAQGFLYSKPIPFEEMTELLKSGKILR